MNNTRNHNTKNVTNGNKNAHSTILQINNFLKPSINCSFGHSKYEIMDKFSYIANAHVSYIDELYRDYKNDPDSIDPSWKEFFDGFDFALTNYGDEEGEIHLASSNGKSGALATPGTMMDMEQLPKEIKVRALIHAYRSRAHLR